MWVLTENDVMINTDHIHRIRMSPDRGYGGWHLRVYFANKDEPEVIYWSNNETGCAEVFTGLMERMEAESPGLIKVGDRNI